jgi:uncharacterized protein (TIGR02117 family)
LKVRTRLKTLIVAVLAALLVPLAYLGVAFAMLFFPAHQQASAGDSTTNAYVITNGLHTDLVFPVRTTQFDWTTVFPTRDFPAHPVSPTYIAIGWGDREFYLHTQNISDITLTRALGALSGAHRTLLHVDYLADINFAERYALPLTEAQYASLIRYVLQSTMQRPDGSAVVIASQHYGALDAFYEARGSYSAFRTCNTWTGAGLRQAGITVSSWTPLDFMVTWHLRKSELP